MIHLVQDFGRVGEAPSLDGFDNPDAFREALSIASDRAEVGKVEK